MSLSRSDTLVILLILSAILAVLVFTFLRRRRERARFDREQSTPPSEGFERSLFRALIFDPWIASITLFLLLLAALLFALAVLGSRAPPDPPDLLAAEVRSLANQVGALGARLDRLHLTPDQQTAPGVDRAGLGRIERELRQFATRMAAAESRIEDGDSRGSMPNWVAQLGIGLVAVGFGGWLIVTGHRGTAALIITGSVGSIAFVQMEPDSLISYHAAGGFPSPDARPIVFLAGAGRAVGELRAYAVPFENNASTMSSAGGEIVKAVANGLRPCKASTAPPLTLTVRGFASSAPFANQSRAGSNRRNLGLAEARTESVVRQLSQELCDAERCGNGRGVRISAGEPWLSYSRMMGAQFFGDASTPDDERTATEFLTRTVLVTVEHPGRCAIR